MLLRMIIAAAIAAAPAAASAQNEAAPLSASARASAEAEGNDLGGNYLLAIGGVLVIALGIFLLVGDFDNDAEPQPASP